MAAGVYTVIEGCINAEIPYLPNVEWFVKVLSYSNVYLNSNEVYDKHAPRNRCTIATAQGAQLLSVPLQSGRNQKKILSEIQIANDGKWQRLHINAIKTAYGKAPYFIHYIDAIEDVITAKQDNLYELNKQLIVVIAKQLQLQLNITPEPIEGMVEMKSLPNIEPVKYVQVFTDKTGFIPGCSIIDLLFNYGPDSAKILYQKT